MDKETLRKVQLVLLEIANEVKRVCEENGIQYFINAGTLLGAVRHSGFIPWDDDFDMGMFREEYDRFCEIAPKKLKSEYSLQTWSTDDRFAIPFAKVRKKNTVYLENKANSDMINGFYVDVFPYDNAPDNETEKAKMIKRLSHIERVILMKCNYRPWMENDKEILTKRIGYFPYKIASRLYTKQSLINQYMRVVHSVPANSEDVYLQFGTRTGFFQKRRFFGEGKRIKFEDTEFMCPIDPDGYLTMAYGDYMTLPPVEKRENRHQILEIKF